MKDKTIYIGVIGAGVVGKATINLLEKNRDIISSRAGANIIIKKIVVRDIAKVNPSFRGLCSLNVDDILDDESISIVVELIGDIKAAYEIAKKALQKKKAFVTANKAMLSRYKHNLQNIALNTPLCFEGSVAGGIPIIKIIKDGLSANHIVSIKGILNGTCNYILTKMDSNECSFEECLKEAKFLGYAERDPLLDISGLDSAHKLIILSSIAYGIDVSLDDILIEGISSIDRSDIVFANEFGYSIKLLALAKKVEDKVELRVHPTLISKNTMLSKVSGVMNAISIIGDSLGESIYYGAGAGGSATASSVVSDIIDIIRNNPSPMHTIKSNLELQTIGNIISRYYLRLNVINTIGTIAKITSVLEKNNISIEVFLQKEANIKSSILLLSTYDSLESNMQNALRDLSNLEVVCAPPHMIRIED